VATRRTTLGLPRAVPQIESWRGTGEFGASLSYTQGRVPQKQALTENGMITPYEIAFLSGHAYRKDPQILPSSYALDIEGAGQWGVGAHDGVSDSFFCTKYIKTGTFESVIAFRGTGGRAADIAVDASHLLTRHSRYLNAARSFMNRYATRETIVTGHSLGGFIAVSMAFNQTVKVVAINPPWMGTLLSSAVDQYKASTSHFSIFKNHYLSIEY
jgi:hypothetical protein